MNKPKKHLSYEISLKPELYEKLNIISKEMNLSINELLNMCMKLALNKMDIKKGLIESSVMVKEENKLVVTLKTEKPD